MSETSGTETPLRILRLQKRADFLRARHGAKAHETAFVLQLVHNTDGRDLRVGFTVTKKVGNAVERNRIKRRLREAVRETILPGALAGHDAVLLARREALDIPFRDLICDIRRAFEKALTKLAATPNGVANDRRTGQNRRRDTPASAPPRAVKS